MSILNFSRAVLLVFLVSLTGTTRAGLIFTGDDAVYDGSLNEWSADSELPMETGTAPD